MPRQKYLILVLNAGSSSVKYSLFKNDRLLDRGIEERIGLRGGAKNHETAIKNILNKLVKSGSLKDLSQIKAVGHRVVHGGETFQKPTVITKTKLQRLNFYSRLAPLHNPQNILGIKISQKLLPQAKNVAVFDTSFYATLRPESFIYAIPYHFYTEHKIRRYGFHGISHQYVSREAQKILGKKIKRLITCHLGAGSSITAIKNGKPIDTSMGFTPLEGLVMETRCGNIDPAVPLYLIKELKYRPDEVDNLLNKKSGFLGICGIKDFREILASKKSSARLAYQIYLQSVVKYIGAYTALLNGLDTLVFTAGIGQGSAKFREDVINRLKFLGARIDRQKNRRSDRIISTPDSKIKILVVRTDEEKMIAEETLKVIK